jgi:hypothetical protein
MADVAERGWKRRFVEPIPLPRGRQLITIEDAGTYITKLPKAEHEAAEWQAAMEALILVATSCIRSPSAARRPPTAPRRRPPPSWEIRSRAP